MCVRLGHMSLAKILFFLFTAFLLVLSYSYYRVDNSLCDALMPEDLRSSSNAEFERWSDCVLDTRHILIRVGLYLFSSFILILLGLLSWKVDCLWKKH